MARKPKLKVRSRGKSWIVEVGATVSVTGRRERLFFSTKREAEARAVQLREEHFKFGVAAHKMPHELQIDAVKAAEILAPYGASLAEAARLFAELRAKQEKSVEFTALIALYLESKDLSDSSAQNYRQASRRLEPALGGKLICDIDANDIRAAFAAAGLPASQRNAFRRMLSAAWNFGVRRDLDTRNPLKKVEVEKLEKGETKILEPGQAAKLMVAAQAYEGGSMLAYFALCTFAGLRPTEAQRLTWDNIDFEKGHIYVPSGKAKTRVDRYVDIEPALAAWLAECPEKTGRICPFDGREFYRRFDEVRDEAGGRGDWSNDVMRHSYCSFWLGLHGDQNRLVEMAGHSISVSLKHYRRATTKAEAIEFWTTVPVGCEKPVLIEAA